jgi:hypothetical protein
LSESVAELNAATEGKIKKTSQCEEWRAKYATDKKAIGNEISIVK